MRSLGAGEICDLWIEIPVFSFACLDLERSPCWLGGPLASDEDVAVLEDDGRVAEDEVNGAVDVAVAVKLLQGVREERVLVGLEVCTGRRRIGPS